MKLFAVACLLAPTLSVVAWANIIPTSTSITGAGPFTWNYSASLSSDQNVNSGLAPTTNPVPHANLTFAGFFTIYDFAGYISGSCAGPAVGFAQLKIGASRRMTFLRSTIPVS